MLFMVIERFRHADPKPIGERFKMQWSNASRGPHLPRELGGFSGHTLFPGHGSAASRIVE